MDIGGAWGRPGAWVMAPGPWYHRTYVAWLRSYAWQSGREPHYYRSSPSPLLSSFMSPCRRWGSLFPGVGAYLQRTALRWSQL
jgi:hypothetical protein